MDYSHYFTHVIKEIRCPICSCPFDVKRDKETKRLFVSPIPYTHSGKQNEKYLNYKCCLCGYGFEEKIQYYEFILKKVIVIDMEVKK